MFPEIHWSDETYRMVGFDRSTKLRVTQYICNIAFGRGWPPEKPLGRKAGVKPSYGIACRSGAVSLFARFHSSWLDYRDKPFEGARLDCDRSFELLIFCAARRHRDIARWGAAPGACARTYL